MNVAIHRTEPVEVFRVVVDDVEPGGRVALPVEAQVRRPAASPVVVLDQRRRVHAGREVVRQRGPLTRFVTNLPCGRSMSLRVSRSDDVSRPSWRMFICGERLTWRARQEAADVRGHAGRNPLAPIGVAHREEIRAACSCPAGTITPGYTSNGSRSPSTCTFSAVDAERIAVLEVQAAVDVQRRRFLQAVEAPVALVAGVRFPFAQSVFRQPRRADVPAQRASAPGDIRPVRSRKPTCGIEVVADFRVARSAIPTSACGSRTRCCRRARRRSRRASPCVRQIR